MKMVLASKNPHKLVEIQKIVERFDIQLVLESELGVDIDVEETGTTFEENSLLKAKAVMEATGLPALADDSGIAVDALNGAPGVYSARYGFDDSLDDWGRLQLLLKNTENVPDGQRAGPIRLRHYPDDAGRAGHSGPWRGPRRIAACPCGHRRIRIRSYLLLPASGQDSGGGGPGGEKSGLPSGKSLEGTV